MVIASLTSSGLSWLALSTPVERMSDSHKVLTFARNPIPFSVLYYVFVFTWYRLWFFFWFGDLEISLRKITFLIVAVHMGVVISTSVVVAMCVGVSTFVVVTIHMGV
jgi:hypothetical protein